MSIRDYQFIVGPETSTLPTATSPSASDDIATKGYVDTTVQTHLDDSSAAHAASAISNTPSGNLAASTVQGALDELQSDIDGKFNTSTGHDHDGSDAKKVLGTSIDSTGASNGYFLQANGSGGSAWAASSASIPFIGARYYRNSSTQTLTLNSYTIVDFNASSWDTNSAVTTGSNWEFTAPATGYYCLDYGTSMSLNGNLDGGDLILAQVYKSTGGAFSAYQEISWFRTPGTFGQDSRHYGSSGPIQLDSGHKIHLRMAVSTGTAVQGTIYTGSATSWINIYKIPA